MNTRFPENGGQKYTCDYLMVATGKPPMTTLCITGKRMNTKQNSVFERRHEKTNVLHMRKQRHRSASR